jgi:glutathione-regulated potassium-efflux system ancillary protein KefC
VALRFRQHSIEQLERQWPMQGDEAALITASKLGRQQFEELLAQEREDAVRLRAAQKSGWAPREVEAGPGGQRQ